MARIKPGPNGTHATPEEPIKQLVDDFVMTISDSEQDIPDLDQDDDAITAEKALTKEESPEPEALSEKQKRGKKRKREKERIAAEEAQANNENDGGLDSDFEFMAGDGGAGVGEYEGWGFEGAKSAMKDGKKGSILTTLFGGGRALRL